MKKSYAFSQSRQGLNSVFKRIGPAARFKRPVRGWIKAIREALGMSSAQLAKRVGIKQPTLTAFEQSELMETIQLGTLRRVAKAMNCTLVYAIIPNKPLENIVRDQTRAVVRRQLRSVEHSMKLEGQGVSAKSFEKRIDALANDVNMRKLWDDA